MKKKSIEVKYSGLYLGVLLIITSLLLLLSIVQGNQVIERDYDLLSSEVSSFWDIVTLKFPVVENIIGPFGAYFGFFIYLLCGLYFSYPLLLALLFIGILTVLNSSHKALITKSLFFICFSLFMNVFLLTLDNGFSELSGFLVKSIHFILTSIFNTTGAAIISSVIAGAFLLAIIETDIVKAIIRYLFKLLLRFLSLFKARDKSEFDREKRKRIKQKKVLQPFKDDNEASEKEDNLTETVIPRIINHTDNKSEPEITIIPRNLPNENALPEQTKLNRKKQKPSSPDTVHTGETADTYQKPSVELFLQSPPIQPYKDREEMEAIINSTSRILIDKLARLGIEAEVVNVNVGPVITQYELRPSPNVKVSRFSNVSNDLALAIKAKSIRVQAPIPGKGLVGVEIPNRNSETIFLKDILISQQMSKQTSKLAIALGKDIVGTPVVADLARMPHLLIAGATGSGKSVCVNSIICNLLFRTEPEELRLVLIDPKRIELSGYEGIPHLIQNIVSDHEEALGVLQWAVNEMERRYELLQRHNVRDITSYNKKVKSISETDEKMESLPFIIIVIDEFADLILKSGRDVEVPITRLAQMARAIGIHLIIATQRPSMKIITGLIKANFPAKIAFRVAQKIDSRVILDMNGAENLLGFGDMLFISPTKALPERIHGAFVSDEEIENLVQYLRTQPKPEQQIEFTSEIAENLEMVDYDDELFLEAAKIVIATGSASVSMLQRHFKIGYARAGRLIDLMEQAKIIGKYAGSKSRDIIVTEEIMDAYGIKN